MRGDIASSRKEALELGMELYMPSRPCRSGNLSPRKAKQAKCICDGCKAIALKTAIKSQRKNRDKVLARHRDYYRRNKETMKEARKAYVDENYEQVMSANREYYEKNKDACNELKRKWHRDNRVKLPPLSRERSKRHYQENKHAYSAKYHKRRAVMLNAMPLWYSELDDFVMQEARGLCKDREEVFGFRWSVDHCVPLQAKEASGLHCAGNIQVIPHHLNLSKSNRMMYIEPLEWLADAQE